MKGLSMQRHKSVYFICKSMPNIIFFQYWIHIEIQCTYLKDTTGRKREGGRVQLIMLTNLTLLILPMGESVSPIMQIAIGISHNRTGGLPVNSVTEVPVIHWAQKLQSMFLPAKTMFKTVNNFFRRWIWMLNQEKKIPL